MPPLAAAVAYACSVLVGAGTMTVTCPANAWILSGVAAPTSAACPQGSAYADGCAAAPHGTFQHADFFTSYALQNGQTFATRPPWNVACVDYACAVPVGTVLKDPATGTLPGNCVFQPTGSPRGGAAVWCPSGANITFDGWDFSLHNCTYLEFGGAITGTPTIKNSKIVSGSNCDNPSNIAIQIKFDYPTANLVMTSNLIDACGKVDAYCVAPIGSAAGAIVIYDARYGSFTQTYNAWLNVNGRFISRPPGVGQASSVVNKYWYAEGMVFNANAPHGEFELFSPRDGSGPTTVTLAQYSFGTCLQPRDAENGLSGGGNATTACFYFSDGYAGAGPPNTFTQVTADHNTVVTNGSTNPPGGGSPPFYVTTSAGMEVAWDIYTNITFDSNYLGPTGSFFCFWNASSPVFTHPPVFTGNVDMIDGSAITGFGVCPGAHP